MLKRIFLTGSLVVALGITLPARADSITYTAILNGGNEVPPTGSLATGTIVLTLNGNLLSVDEIFTGLTAAASAAHIHCCGPAGINEPVALPFVGFPTATSGTYDHTFDLSLFGTYTASFITNFGGGTAAGAEAALIAGLNSGDAYANIHNTLFPGGEIRGQLEAATTPEPTTLLLLGTGMIGLLQTVRRRIRV